MSTVALTSVDRVRARLNLTDDDDEAIKAVIESAMLAGPPTLGARLRTPFEFASYEDKYKINLLQVMPEDGFVRLRTTAGFIQEDTVVVTYGETIAEARIGTVIAADELIISAERGWVSVPESYDGKYIVVKYDAGFEDLDGVPEWLQEVATNHAITVMSIHQMDDKSAELSTTLKTLNAEIDAVLNGHLRVNVSAVASMR